MDSTFNVKIPAKSRLLKKLLGFMHRTESIKYTIFTGIKVAID